MSSEGGKCWELIGRISCIFLYNNNKNNNNNNNNGECKQNAMNLMNLLQFYFQKEYPQDWHEGFMMHLNVVARFNKTSANTFQVLRNELMKAWGGGDEELSYLGIRL